MTYEEKYLNLKRDFVLKTIRLHNKTDNRQIHIPRKFQTFDDFLSTPEICSKCGGKCCKHFPCLFSPYDFIDVNNIDYMKNILDIGIICIAKSCYDNTLVLRPRGIKDKKKIVSTRLPLDNKCILYSETGCMLSSSYRPAEALLYYAQTIDNHIPIYHTSDCTEDWQKYHDSMKILYDYYRLINSPILREPEPKQVKTLTRRIAGYKN